MPPTALITGATAGLGASFARRLAAEGYDLILVARDADRLASTAQELAGRYGVTVDAVTADLSTEEGIAAVEERLAGSAGPPVEMLVNNAGFGLNTGFTRSSVFDESRLIQVNVLAVMRLTHAALPGMIARGRGDVINVSSVAGFFAVMPGSTYPATKAWVTNFSQSVAHSVRSAGVRVMALCPGYVRTEFHQRAGINMSKTPNWAWLTADTVVRAALRDLRRGTLVSVPDWKYKLAVGLGRHMPLALVRRVARDTRGR